MAFWAISSIFFYKVPFPQTISLRKEIYTSGQDLWPETSNEKMKEGLKNKEVNVTVSGCLGHNPIL